jgi:hypothetical protein
MIETFTKNSSITSNGIEMERHNNSENLGADELAFFNSLTEGLDALKREPKAESVQGILNYSKKFRSIIK